MSWQLRKGHIPVADGLHLAATTLQGILTAMDLG
jgi:hypothetical protein